jgi:hypothetical protein
MCFVSIFQSLSHLKVVWLLNTKFIWVNYIIAPASSALWTWTEVGAQCLFFHSCSFSCFSICYLFAAIRIKRSAQVNYVIALASGEGDVYTAFPNIVLVLMNMNILFICSLFKKFSQQLRPYSVRGMDDRWMMNWKGCGRKQLWRNWRYYPSICWRDRGKQWKISARIAGFQADPPEYKAGVLTTVIGNEHEK